MKEQNGSEICCRSHGSDIGLKFFGMHFSGSGGVGIKRSACALALFVRERLPVVRVNQLFKHVADADAVMGRKLIQLHFCVIF